jgi:Kef-type K+ transport system membrane component KefB
MSKRLISLYPEAWRDRYGEEMSALLDQTPATFTVTLDLLRGALSAHLQPLANSAPSARARGTIAQVLGCFIVFCVFGAGFAKTTENYDQTEHLHPLLGISHAVVLTAALVGAAALALAAVPLVLTALADARRRREPALIRLIAVPPTAIAVFAGSFGLLALWLNAHHHRAGVGGWLLLGVCLLCAGIGGFACWAAPRAIMRRVHVPRRAFAFSVPAVALVAFCMVAVATATGAFLVGIVADAPRVGASGNGPGQLIDVTTSIAIQFTGMLGLSVIAAVSAARGLRSLRER